MNQHWKYIAIWSKIHSSALLFLQICRLESINSRPIYYLRFLFFKLNPCCVFWITRPPKRIYNYFFHSFLDTNWCDGFRQQFSFYLPVAFSFSNLSASVSCGLKLCFVCTGSCSISGLRVSDLTYDEN